LVTGSPSAAPRRRARTGSAAYGPGFATPETSDEEFVRSLIGMVCGYLLRG
jgi:hypothetical protein